MKQKKWIALSLGAALFTTGCTTALGEVRLEGLESLTQQLDSATSTGPATADRANGPLQVVADSAEASAQFLDVVQITIDQENDLVVFAVFVIPTSVDPAEGQSIFRASVEAIWRAAADEGLQVNNIAVASLQIIPLNTLDRGLAPGGWLIGGIQVPHGAAAEYLLGEVDAEARAEFWLNGPVESTQLDQPYVGTPNHPLRSLEA